VPAQGVQELVLTKDVDSSPPQLIMNGVLGQAAKEATLAMRKAGKDQQEFLVVKMNDVLVSSYQTGGSSGSEAQLMDQLVLHFSSISGEYRPQKADGTLGTPVSFQISGDCNEK
jgi:type VI secretion system secreted protein Hcp